MTVPLQQFQTRLEKHFASLASARRGSAHPIFALEHGLATDEVEVIARVLTERRSRYGFEPTYWLPWVVYASEIGYDFNGMEYWQSFDDRTAYISTNNDRYLVRNWFEHFAKTFFGVKPSGSWSRYRTIICWPITHAVLPRDLQVQLAQAIYEARYELRECRDIGVKEVGRRIAKHSWYPTSRYRDFLSEHELVGQIVVGLLEEGSEDDAALLPATQQRLTQALQDAYNTKEWLEDARQEYRRPQIKLAGRSIGGTTGYDGSGFTSEIESLDRLSLRPALSVRRLQERVWRVLIGFPSFQPLAKVSAESDKFFANERMEVLGSKLGKRPAKWLFHGGHQTELEAWPNAGECLVKFGTYPAPFQEVLDRECKIDEMAVWPFKINADGAEARLVRGGVLQAGARYVLLSRTLLNLSGFGTPCDVNCKDAYGLEITLPNAVPNEVHQLLGKLHLHVGRSIRIEPVAFLPRQWDTAVGGEWTTQDEPCLAVTSDYEVPCLEMRVDNEPWVQFAYEADRRSLLVRLGRLPSGRHELTVRTPAGTSTKPYEHNQIRVPIVIREPRSGPGSALASSMIIDYAPMEPSVDDLVDQKFELTIEGEISRKARVTVELLAPGGEILSTEIVLTHNLPIKPVVWGPALANFMNGRADLPFFQAASAFLVIDCEDLGGVRLRLEGHYGAVRWSRRSADQSLALLNHGDEAQLQLAHYSFAYPLKPISIDVGRANSGFRVDSPGGLYVARLDLSSSLVVVTPNHRVLQSLSAPITDGAISSNAGWSVLSQALADWNTASAANYLSSLWRQRVVREIREQLVRILFGQDWLREERQLRDNSNDVHAWERLEQLVHHHINFGAALGRTRLQALSERNNGFLTLFIKRCRDHHISHDDEMIRAAWAIASDLENHATATGDAAQTLVSSPHSHRALLRGARLLWLCSQNRTEAV